MNHDFGRIEFQPTASDIFILTPYKATSYIGFPRLVILVNSS
jgi:hypothetical protein